jgi:hypothetical protein
MNNGGVHEFEGNIKASSSLVCNQNQENGLELVLKDARLNTEAVESISPSRPTKNIRLKRTNGVIQELEALLEQE